MKTAKLTLLTFLLLCLAAEQRQIKYFLSEHDFMSGHDVPKSEVIQKAHVQAEYDDKDRLILKSNFNARGDILSQEQYSYIDTNMIIRQKDLVDDSGHIFHQAIFGREPHSISYIEWVFGVDSVKKWDDRFTTSDLNEIDKPDNYRFYDVDAFEYGGKEIDYDSLGRVTRDEWFRRPDDKSMHKFLYRYYDDTNITHMFEYDSNGVLIMDVKLSPDGTEAIFWFTGPPDTSVQNHSTVAYNLDGDLSWGSIHWAVPGENDSASIDLSNILRGDYTLSLETDSSLRDSAVYDIHFDGNGVKGYRATKRTIHHITYDISPPLMTLDMDKYLKEVFLSFTSSEPMDSAFIVWAPDSNFTHIASDTVILTHDELLATDRFRPSHQTDLVDGVMYDPEIYGFDIAGNLSQPGIRQDVIYDVTPPVLTISEPLSGAWVNHQNISMGTNEPIQNWTITAQWQGGLIDESAPYSYIFSDTVQLSDDKDLMAFFQLNDGSVYSYSIVGSDLAGNESDAVSIDSIHFDITLPVLTMIYPFDDAAIKDPSVSYASSEILLAGEFLWTEIEGTMDTLSPHVVTLVDGELSAEEKIHIRLKNAPVLTDGSVYAILFTGQDLAGNESEPVTISNVLFDTTPPAFTYTAPGSGSALNHQAVSYEVSENLFTGAILWSWVDGKRDTASQHRVELKDIELTAGRHDSIVLSNMPQLTDGGIYSILFTGSDRAGNVADTIVISDILYDYTAPEMVIDYPLPRSISNTTAMTYTLSEDIHEGRFKWIWLGGVEDTLAPYTAILNSAERSGGAHSQIELYNNPTVVENALYTMTFSGRDRAGNKTKPAFVPGLQYDFTPPELTWISPKDGEAVNHKNIQFSNSELLESGTISWTWVDGVNDPDSVHVMSLEGPELSRNEFGPGLITNEPPLVDGGIYSISYVGFDPAGNESNHINIQNVLYDITQPEITINYPLPKSISRTSAVTYTLSEDLDTGRFKWIWLGGVKDTLAPYTAILTEEEMQQGDHIEVELSNNPTVVENALYTMSITGTDRAGNKTKRAFVPGLQYDFTPPELTIISPENGDAVNHKKIHFMNSEKLASAQMIYRRTGGIPDPSSPHMIELSGEELHGKELGPLDLATPPTLMDGAIYSILYVAFDPAGNQSDTTRKENILYDVTPPTLAFTYPESQVFTTKTTLLFDVSEAIYNFNIQWDGLGKESEPHAITFSYPDVLDKGSFNSDDLTIPSLKDGFAYSITLNGSDRAGNMANPATLSDVKIDLTPPEFTAFTPQSGSFINQVDIGWTLSEDIAEGSVSFQHAGTDGELVSELINLELNAGDRIPLGLENSVDLRDGMKYTITVTGIDFAGNISKPSSVDDITYDISPPEIIITQPKSDSFVNILDVVYSVNEPLLSGQMIWINERDEKMVFDLRSEDLSSGKHILKDYSISPEEDMPYRITIEGIDRANNKRTSDSIENVMFDVTPPVLTILSPLSNSPINHTKLTLSISEPIEFGSVRWHATEGNDPKSPHIRPLKDELLTGGDFIDYEFSAPPQLVNGVSYTITIEGSDLAGNLSESYSVDGILFDTIPPEFVNVTPMDKQHIREANIEYTLTEDLVSGKIYFDHVGGTSDPKTTHMITLAGGKKKKGVQGGKLPASFVKLVNGAVYNIRFEGLDAAGNMAPDVLVTEIVFDDEPPSILISDPVNNSYRNTQDISFSISEDLTEGIIELSHIGDKADPNAPYKFALEGKYLQSGLFEKSRFPELKWVDGATYTLTINGIDPAGNVAKESKISHITYDITPPVITIDNMVNDSYINTNALSYSLSENLKNSTIVFTQTSGAADPRSPHTVALSDSELNGGNFINKALRNGPNLQNGSIYKIEFNGLDYAGNDAAPIILSNIVFDNQPPELSISRPIDSEQIKKTIVSYMSNELLKEAVVIYSQTSGTIDGNSPHRVSLTGALLTEGVHSDHDIGITSQLADGGRYTVSIEAWDKAGNPATITPINDVYFDILPPALSLSAPKSGSIVNTAVLTYGTSEEMGKGQMRFVRSGGAEDPLSPHEIEMTGMRLKQGDHYDESFENDMALKDGGIYTIEFSGEDLAGNVSELVSINNITFDITLPEIAITQPIENGFYNQINLDYELKELLASGSIILERRGGNNDPMSPHTIDLLGDQLNAGQIKGININSGTNLTSNTTYNIRIEGQDMAGNKGKSAEITGVTFDDIPPEISITSPSPDSYINTPTLGLRTNEVLSEAQVEWIWVEGNPDPAGTHVSKMIGDQLLDGDYPEVNFDPAPALTSGAWYRVVYTGTDRAGNSSTTELGNLFFDNEPPVVSVLFPIENGFTNINEVSYTLNEPLLMANLIWTPIDGSGPLSIDMIGDELKAGSFSQGKLTNQLDLTDGTIYNLSITAIDRSGNEAVLSLAKNVTYDKSKPKFTDVFPSTSARVNSQLLKWTVNEELVSGKYTWIHMGGNADPSAPHTFELTPELLSAASHDNSTLPDLALVTDAMYRITLQGTDKAGNTGKKFIMSVVFDDIPPTLEIKYPESKTAVNHLDVAYGISEGLSTGQFIYTQVGGVSDPNSPVTFDLVGTELETIIDPPKLPKNPPVLQDGSIYNIVFKGVDLAMNTSESNLIDSVKYDITRPVITIHNPQPKSNLMGVEISIEISEDLMDGKMVWTRTGGLKSRVTRQKIPLYNEYLAEGMHPHAKLPMDKTLSASVIYSLSVDAQDFAKNQAEPVEVEKIEYIRSMAGKWYYKGQIIEVVWVFEPDDSGMKGRFMQGLSLGTKISDQEKGDFEFDFSRKPWVLTLDMDNSKKNRISLMEFIDNTHMRVVTGEKKPRNWQDGEVMEYEWRPE